MEDILASIRRILNEDETAPAESTAPEEPAKATSPAAHMPEEVTAGGSGASEDEDVLLLDEGMLVNAPGQNVPPPLEPQAAPTPPESPQEASPAYAFAPPPPPAPPPLEISPGGGLLAPESAAAAASSVDALVRTLSQERSTQVHRGGPTIEDLVREEIRPLLKAWLDQHLPPLVERLVRQEIERVAGRAGL